MNRSTVLLAALCILGAHAPGDGQGRRSAAGPSDAKVDPSYEKYAIIEKLVGTWDTSAVSGGKKVEGRFDCKWGPGRYCAIWTIEIWEAEKPQAIVERMSGIMGWNAHENRIIEQVHSSTGICLKTNWRTDGNKLVGERQGVDAEGRNIKSEKPVELIFDADQIRIAPLRYVTENGDVVVEFTDIVWHRRGVRQTDDTRNLLKEFGEAMVGRWMGEVKIPFDLDGFGSQGERAVNYISNRWIADERGMETEWLCGKATGTSLTFWDAESRSVKQRCVSSDGRTYELEFSKDGKNWAWTLRGCFGDGTILEGRGHYVIQDGRAAFVSEGVLRVGGEAHPPFSHVYKRMH